MANIIIPGENPAPEPTGGYCYDANELKKHRPDLRLAHLRCCKCRKKPEQLASYGLHVGGSDHGQLSGKGAIHAQVKCHGDTEEILITFEDANRYIQSGELIPVFDNVNPWAKEKAIQQDSNLQLRGFAD